MSPRRPRQLAMSFTPEAPVGRGAPFVSGIRKPRYRLVFESKTGDRQKDTHALREILKRLGRDDDLKCIESVMLP